MTFSARYRVRVQWADCDANRHVYYPNYFRMFDSATHHMFEAAGLPVPRVIADYGLLGLHIVDAHAAFKASCGWGDWIEVESRISEWRRTSFVVGHRVWNGEVLAAEGHEIRVWTVPRPDDPGEAMGGIIPEAFKARFRDEETP